MISPTDNTFVQGPHANHMLVEKGYTRVNNGTIILPVNMNPKMQVNIDKRTTSEQNPYKVIDIAHILVNPLISNQDQQVNKSRLTLSIAPGKKDNRWNRNLDLDLETIKNNGINGINVIVCLLEWSEMRMLNLTDYPRKAQEKGFIFYHLPIKDRGVTNQKELATLIPMLVQHLSSGHNVLVHCRGGLGRAGTICGCCLGHFGYQGPIAIETVRGQRPGAIQTTKQEQCVIEYCRSLIIA